MLAFARRHVGDQTAHDVVAETFLVAWRRWDDVPDPAIGWLLSTARRTMQNRARGDRRLRGLRERVALLDRVAADLDGPTDAAEVALERSEALERLARLDPSHREALLLVAWDGLSADEAAAALGIRPAAFRKRLSRARAALEAMNPVQAGHPAQPIRESR